MSLLSFRASKLYRQKKTSGYTDENGDYHPGTSQWEFCCYCDVVPAGEANKIVSLTVQWITILIASIICL